MELNLEGEGEGEREGEGEGEREEEEGVFPSIPPVGHTRVTWGLE